MAALKDKIQNALDESRMLVLGVQVLLGFQFQVILEKSFDQLPYPLQIAKLGALGLMLVTLTLLMAPAPYHHLVAKNQDTEDLNQFTTKATGTALFPFALGLGLDTCIATYKILGTLYSIIFGLFIMALALFYWYGLETLHRSHHKGHVKEQPAMEKQNPAKPPAEKSKLTDQIRHTLTEARMVLPGAQALLGFQFIATFKEGFDKLPPFSQHLHLVSLALIAFCTILLMAPAAYHRIVEEGEETEHFLHLAGRFVLAAMVPLALGMCLDFYIVLRKVTHAPTLSLCLALIMLCVSFGLWFGYTFYCRSRLSQPQPAPEAAPGEYATS